MEEGKDGYVAVDGKDFGEKIGGVDQAGEEDKAEKVFARTEEAARPIANSLSTKRRGGNCWGWPRLVSVSVSSANTCPPPKAVAYSASATDATTTGMRLQKAWRGALWVVVEGNGWEGCDWMRREARTRGCFSLILCLRLSGGGLRR